MAIKQIKLIWGKCLKSSCIRGSFRKKFLQVAGGFILICLKAFSPVSYWCRTIKIVMFICECNQQFHLSRLWVSLLFVIATVICFPTNKRKNKRLFIRISLNKKSAPVCKDIRMRSILSFLLLLCVRQLLCKTPCHSCNKMFEKREYPLLHCQVEITPKNIYISFCIYYM